MGWGLFLILFTFCGIVHALRMKNDIRSGAAAADFKTVDVPSQNGDGQPTLVRYYISTEQTTRKNAVVTCKESFRKQLVSIQTREKNEEIKAAIIRSGIGSADTWFWTSGIFNETTLWFYWETARKNFTYSNWDENGAFNFGGGSPHGVVVNSKERNWFVAVSTYMTNFICE